MWVVFTSAAIIFFIFVIGVAIIVWLLIRAVVSYLKRKNEQ